MLEAPLSKEQEDNADKESIQSSGGLAASQKKTRRHGRIREIYSGKHWSDCKRSRSRDRKRSRSRDRRSCRSVERWRRSRSRDRSVRRDRRSRSPRSDRGNRTESRRNLPPKCPSRSQTQSFGGLRNKLLDDDLSSEDRNRRTKLCMRRSQRVQAHDL
ncbi:hypothetical protein JTE90_027838 [Oedothorax gibbosus]|uniref:Uncharacterized protein n=1 Tax=Oedothorax gibbosus TaxID=931172 RepID=A0AAV6U3L9_9ARAC|nr:hypothetical protein JTE90_027838 [Oedothorax gibbosus]